MNGTWKGYEKPGGRSFVSARPPSGINCNAERWNAVDRRRFICPGTMQRLADNRPLVCSECGRKQK